MALHAASATFQNILGRTLAGQKKWPEAETAFARAVELQPEFAEGHFFNLANALLAQNKISEAKTHYASALQAQTKYPEAKMQLPVMFLRGRKNAEAIAHLRHVVEQRPQWKEPINNLAWLLATEALTWAPQTIRVCATNDFSALDTVAAAYAESGQFEQARNHAEKALSVARGGRHEFRRPNCRPPSISNANPNPIASELKVDISAWQPEPGESALCDLIFRLGSCFCRASW